MFRITLGLLVCLCTPIAVRAAEPPKAAPLQLPADFDAKAAEYLAARVKVSHFNGVVLVAVDGQPVFRRGYGSANLDYDLPNTPGTKFRVGSVSKQFTDAAILKLEEQGKLAVTDPVGMYVPDCPEAWADVTLLQLMSHTGGIPEYTPKVSRTPGGWSRPYAPRELIDLMRDKPLDFTPGEKWSYSNTGYVLLGMVIEAASGSKYADYLRDTIFAPLGMTDSGVETGPGVLPNRATGYIPSQGKLVPMYLDMSVFYGDGAVYSTADDLILWDRALAANMVLGPAATEKMFTPVKKGYACGWMVDRKFGQARQHHSGHVPGFTTQLARYPDVGMLVVVLSNADQFVVVPMADDLAAIALGEKYQLPKPPEPKKTPKDEKKEWTPCWVADSACQWPGTLLR
jgi:CubicO group peptidase (beta-lactamase class C family)